MLEEIDRKCKELTLQFNALEEKDASINVNIIYEKKRGKRLKQRLKAEQSKIERMEEQFTLSKVGLPKIEGEIKELEVRQRAAQAELDRIIEEVQVF